MPGRKLLFPKDVVFHLFKGKSLVRKPIVVL